MLVASVVGIMIAIVVGVILVPTLAVEPATPMLGAILNILPIVFVVSVILRAVAMIGGSSRSTNSTEEFNWYDYGKRIKKAYSTKFGYRNPDYEEEVDRHIEVMRTQDEGPTYEVAEDWLKRQAHFVEVGWKDLDYEASQDRSDWDNPKKGEF
mgnify:CR=1 FL=1